MSLLPHEPFLPRQTNGRMVPAYIYTQHPLRDGTHGFEEFVYIDSMNENVVLVLVPKSHPRAGFVLVHRSDIINFFTHEKEQDCD